MPDKDAPALRLAEAKSDLEDKLHDVLRAYEARVAGDIEINLDADKLDAADGPYAGDAELRTQIRNLIDAFHAKTVVKQTGVTVEHVTAIDSDADGTIAVNVKYEYAV